jgi:hypothetical protein
MTLLELIRLWRLVPNKKNRGDFMKWLPLIVTSLSTILTAVFTPSFVTHHLILFAILNAAAQLLHSVLPSTLPAPAGTITKMIVLGFLLLTFSSRPVEAQTPTPAFTGTTVSFNLTPITLPGGKQTLSGAETDVMLSPTPNNAFGETTLINSAYTFLGGRYNRLFPSVSKWLNNLSPNLNGLAFQFGLTGSLGVVNIPGNATPTHWGERAGGFLNYQIGSSAFGLGVEAQWCNFPGYAHNTYSVAFGPNFHF